MTRISGTNLIKPITFKRQILSNSEQFKSFWKQKGPYKYALTSLDFPPVMLHPEEWLFSNNIIALLKELMQFDKRKMKIVQAAFNPENKNILRPDKLIPWKINNFPEEWNFLRCNAFVPEGHLTCAVLEQLKTEPVKIEVVKTEQNKTRQNKTRHIEPDKIATHKKNINGIQVEPVMKHCTADLVMGHLSLDIIESAFFKCLENLIEQTGHMLLKPKPMSKYADIKEYLSEWEEDDNEQ